MSLPAQSYDDIGGPAFGLYVTGHHGGVMHFVGLLVLTLSGEMISAITRFETGMRESFGLPRTLDADEPGI